MSTLKDERVTNPTIQTINVAYHTGRTDWWPWNRLWYMETRNSETQQPTVQKTFTSFMTGTKLCFH